MYKKGFYWVKLDGGTAWQHEPHWEPAFCDPEFENGGEWGLCGQDFGLREKDFIEIVPMDLNLPYCGLKPGSQ